MNPWLALAGFVAWTSAVWYFADQHGHARAERACQEERDEAVAAQQVKESEHAEAARKFEGDRKNDRDHIDKLKGELARAARDKPVPAGCRLDAERVNIWNRANAGPSDQPGQ